MSYVAPPPGTAVEIQRAQPPADHVMTERGVIIHSAMTWLVAYFPGDPGRLADPADPASIRVLRTADVAAYRDLADCDPAWVIGTWNHLDREGPGLLQAPQATRVWELAARLAQHQVNANVASMLTHAQLEHWAGRPLTEDDIDRLDDAIPHSSIPDAIAAIVDGMDSSDAEQIGAARSALTRGSRPTPRIRPARDVHAAVRVTRPLSTVHDGPHDPPQLPADTHCPRQTHQSLSTFSALAGASSRRRLHGHLRAVDQGGNV